MRDLKQLVKEVKIATEKANVEIGNDPRTYTAKLGKVRRAKEDLKELFIQYRNEVRNRVVFILPTGESSDAFSKIATEELGCFAVDAEGPYKDTIVNINPALYNKHPFDPAILSTLTNYFQDVADEMGLLSYPQPVFKNKYAKTLNSKEELLESVKEVFVEEIGSEIVGHYAINKVAIEGIKEDFNGKIVPIVLNTKDSKLIEKLEKDLRRITIRVFLIETKDQISVKDVEKELKNIKKSISIK